MQVRRVSQEFCLSSLTRPNDCDRIQFVMNLERVGDILILPYGRQDLEPMVLTTAMTEVLAMLRPLEDLNLNE